MEETSLAPEDLVFRDGVNTVKWSLLFMQTNLLKIVY